MLVAVEPQDRADAFEHLAANPAFARLQAAEGAIVNLGKPGDFFLGQPAIAAEAHEEPAKILAGSRRCPEVSVGHRSAPLGHYRA